MKMGTGIECGIKYQLVRSSRTTVAIQISREGEVVVRAPRGCPQSSIDAFVTEKQAWIERKVGEVRRRNAEREQAGSGESRDVFRLPGSPKEEAVYRAQAAEVFARKAAYYAERMNVTFNKITIRDQKTRWGSCSSKGNLNFNWRLVLAPVPVLDYVVIHELAHCREMNHSSRFWDIVGEMMPDYRIYRKWLREHGECLMNR